MNVALLRVLLSILMCGLSFVAQAAVLPTTGLQAHFKGDAGVVTGGGGIAQWLDQAALNGLNNANATVSWEPQVASAAIGYHAAFPTVSFTGGDHLAFSLPAANAFTGMTTFVVGNTGAAQSSFETVLSTGGSGGSSGVRWAMGMGSAASQGLGWAGPTSLVNLGNGAALSLNTWHVLSWAKNATTWNVRRERPTSALLTTVGDTSTFGGAWNAVIGTEAVGTPATYSFSGQIAELLIYDRTLNATEYQQVLDYLTERFFVAPVVVPVPEPATGWLLAPGATWFLRRRASWRASQRQASV